MFIQKTQLYRVVIIKQLKNLHLLIAKSARELLENLMLKYQTLCLSRGLLNDSFRNGKRARTQGYSADQVMFGATVPDNFLIPKRVFTDGTNSRYYL